ncbi:putative bifunctional diguanylate cyclase/phosphodiesterase [Desulfovibrio desulfuricans]|uniref:putative bifunctional diguanylate cyclase/phosphodiesterase n=1 Tax=Desulfovibrio desulfuricans TaxID=876 RepID=UPI0035B46167
MKILSPANIATSAISTDGGQAVEDAGKVYPIAMLQSHYDDISLIDFETDVFSNIYHNPAHFAPADPALSLSEKIRADVAERVHPEDAGLFASFFSAQGLQKRMASAHAFAAQDIRQKALDGSYRWVRILAFAALRHGEGQMYLVCTEDMQSRHGTGEIGHDNEHLVQQKLDALRYKAVVDHTRTLVFEWRGKDLTYLSPRIPEMLAGDYDGRNPFDVWREDDVLYAGDMEPFDTCLARLALGIRSGEINVRLRRRDGQYIWCKVTYTKLDGGESNDRYIGTLNDVDASTRSEQALRLRAEHDPLTGAYNTQTFFEKIDKLVKNRAHEQYCILRFDVAGFKGINESFGLEEGNRLLRGIARLVRQRLTPEKEVFARLTADVFAVCLAGDSERALQFVQALSLRLEHYSDTFRVKLFFGICPVENPRTPAHILCDWAYLAQKTVKGSDIVNFAFYDEVLRKKLHDESYITDQMYEALEKGQFRLFLQPKVQISSGRIVGAEALVRWQHPTDGLILPGRFIPLFERNGFIVRLDSYIWDQTCQILRTWLDKKYDPTPISVNMSRLHFNDDDLPNKLVSLLNKYNLPRHMLELELTESAFFANEPRLIRIMNELRAAGFVFSMDDFGTGYSSLSTLRDLPFSVVKLDRAFISDGINNQRGQIVARNTIALARDLNMSIVAEGVETKEHARFLLNSGCNCAQGFYYSRPVDTAEFEVLSFVQEKAFWVHPQLKADAVRLGLPISNEAPPREY